MNAIMLIIITTAAMRINQGAIGPEPKTIGNGPMNIIIPVLDDVSDPFINDAIMIAIMPVKIIANPTKNSSGNTDDFWLTSNVCK
jgi:hypothetical protein